MRNSLKRSLEYLLRGSGLTGAARSFHRRGTFILAYHNIVPTGEAVRGEASLHLRQEQFAQQLELLQRTHDIVPLISLGQTDRRRRPRAVITFDDACQGALTAGVAELASRGLPATIFVAPGLLDGRTFWWDAFADPGTGTLPDDFREIALGELQGNDAAIRVWANERGHEARRAPAHQTGATEVQLQKAVETPGITLAAHSWSHSNLMRLAAHELPNEIVRPLNWLRERFAQVLPWLSYPYGRSSRLVEQAAAAAGYLGGLLIEGGFVRGPLPMSRRFSIPRVNIPAGVSLDGFELRVSGLRS